MLYTTRNNFNKPEGTDYIDISYLTANWDAIDVMVSKHNLNAATAPTVNDDSADGYSIGSLWYDLTGSIIYTAKDVTIGAAVWLKIYAADPSTYATVASLANYAKLDGSNNFTAGLTLAQIATPAAPAANLTKFYTKADGLLYYIVNGGAETKVYDSAHTHAAYTAHALATAANDFLVASGSGTFVKKTLAETKTILDITESHNWTQITAFTATPPSTSTITTTSDLTGTLKVGMPLKYTIGGTVYYGIITIITSNTITIAGASLVGDITALYYGLVTRVTQVDFFVSGTFSDADNDALLDSDMNTAFRWRLGAAYCVKLGIYTQTVDTGAEPNVNLLIEGGAVCTANTNEGRATSTTAKTWVETDIDISTTNYSIANGEDIEISTDKNGNGDAGNLTVSAVFVLE